LEQERPIHLMPECIAMLNAQAKEAAAEYDTHGKWGQKHLKRMNMNQSI